MAEIGLYGCLLQASQLGKEVVITPNSLWVSIMARILFEMGSSETAPPSEYIFRSYTDGVVTRAIKIMIVERGQCVRKGMVANKTLLSEKNICQINFKGEADEWKELLKWSLQFNDMKFLTELLTRVIELKTGHRIKVIRQEQGIYPYPLDSIKIEKTSEGVPFDSQYWVDNKYIAIADHRMGWIATLFTPYGETIQYYAKEDFLIRTIESQYSSFPLTVKAIVNNDNGHFTTEFSITEPISRIIAHVMKNLEPRDKIKPNEDPTDEDYSDYEDSNPSASDYDPFFTSKRVSSSSDSNEKSDLEVTVEMYDDTIDNVMKLNHQQQQPQQQKQQQQQPQQVDNENDVSYEYNFEHDDNYNYDDDDNHNKNENENNK